MSIHKGTESPLLLARPRTGLQEDGAGVHRALHPAPPHPVLGFPIYFLMEFPVPYICTLAPSLTLAWRTHLSSQLPRCSGTRTCCPRRGLHSLGILPPAPGHAPAPPWQGLDQVGSRVGQKQGREETAHGKKGTEGRTQKSSRGKGGKRKRKNAAATAGRRGDGV